VQASEGGLTEELRERTFTYLRTLEAALERVRSEGQAERLKEREREVLKLAKCYLSDAKYYAGIGDYVTALAAASYAEGLLDALARLGALDIEWKRERRKRVLVAGTFDILHPGHLALLHEASKLGDVYVVVSRDENAKKAKGRDPVLPESARLLLVESLKPVRKAVLGELGDFLKKVVELKPDVVLLGPDQPFDERELKEELERRGLKGVEVLRLRERVAGPWPSSSSEIIAKILKSFCEGARISEAGGALR